MGQHGPLVNSPLEGLKTVHIGQLEIKKTKKPSYYNVESKYYSSLVTGVNCNVEFAGNIGVSVIRCKYY